MLNVVVNSNVKYYNFDNIYKKQRWRLSKESKQVLVNGQPIEQISHFTFLQRDISYNSTNKCKHNKCKSQRNITNINMVSGAAIG